MSAPRCGRGVFGAAILLGLSGNNATYIPWRSYRLWPIWSTPLLPVERIDGAAIDELSDQINAEANVHALQDIQMPRYL
jgi:hypothetical protein